MLISVEFTSAQRLVEMQKFEKLLIITTQTFKLNQINNTACDLLISSIENGRKDRESLFKSWTQKFLNRAGVHASSIYASLHKHFVESMGTCEQIKAKCQTLSMNISADSLISMVSSDPMLLFNDYRCRDVLNRELLESEKIAYLATAFEFYHDQIFEPPARQISQPSVSTPVSPLYQQQQPSPPTIQKQPKKPTFISFITISQLSIISYWSI